MEEPGGLHQSMESQSQTRLSNFTFRGQLTFSRHFLSVHPSILRISFCSYEAEKSLISVWCAVLTQSCLTLCLCWTCGLPGSCVHGILQARILEWVAMPSSRGSSQPRCPAMHADSLPSEPPSGGLMFYEKNLKGYCLNIQDISRASLIAQLVKICLQCRRPGFDSWVWKILWRAWQLTPAFWFEYSRYF